MPPCEARRWAHVLSLPALAAMGVLGCSGGHDRSTQSGSPVPSATTTSDGSTQAASNGSEGTVTPGSLTVADLDVYEKGTKARLALLMQVRKDLDAAKSTQDTVQAMTRTYSDAPDSETARAAGVSVLHVQQVMQAVGNVIATLHMQEAASIARQVDTAHLDAAALAQMRPMLVQQQRAQDSTTKALVGSMTPDVAAAFQQRRADLDSLTFQTINWMAATKKS